MYFSNLFDKLSEFGHHHQILFGVIVALTILLISWAIERLLDLYIFPNKHPKIYIGVIFGGLEILYIIQHLVLHVF